MKQTSPYVRQLLAGRDFAVGSPLASQMQNFAYLIVSPDSAEALLVDPAWDVPGLLAVAEREQLRIVGALVTHYHPDHVGGDLFGHQVEGVAEFLAHAAAPIYVNRHEAEGLKRVTGASDSDLRLIDNGERLELDSLSVEFLHTPGHTPGSQCFLVNDEALVAGDTLFIGGCGRVDLPGGDEEEMFRSLNQRLGRLPGETLLYPGHDYGSVPVRSLREERRSNAALLAPSLEVWRRLMGRA